jgi:hypothetical protein
LGLVVAIFGDLAQHPLESYWIGAFSNAEAPEGAEKKI